MGFIPATTNRMLASRVGAGKRLIDDMPSHLAKFQFSRSGGPGGQNVNKVNTKAEIRFDINAAIDSGFLTKEIATRLRQENANRVTNTNELVITAQTSRSQRANRDDCYEKLSAMLEIAKVPPKERNMYTEISEKGKAKRREQKRRRGETKANRKPVSRKDW